ncbi:hypothetical protein [Sphingomonas sp.]|uniref:hypothetical protein n=1 Tax=Sphingomonas sp. TaxID=28214 RepID=UPI003B3BE4BF
MVVGDPALHRATRAFLNRRSLLLKLAAVATAAGGTYLLLRPGQVDPKQVAARAAVIDQAYGVRIGYGDPASFYVPPYGPRDAIIPDGHATAAAPADVALALDAIAQSLAVYPPGFYASLCKAIFLCGTLRFGNEAAGGTYGPAWIILAADPSVGAGGIRETARLGVHHEFSSLVLKRAPLIEMRWRMLMPADWEPDPTNDQALRHDGGANVQEGFLSSYGATSLENDFNTYAETAFANPERLIALAQDDPVIRTKAALLLEAYAAHDPRIMQTYRKLGLNRIASA